MNLSFVQEDSYCAKQLENIIELWSLYILNIIPKWGLWFNIIRAHAPQIYTERNMKGA